MPRFARFLAVTAVAALALAPVLAEARPGGSSSSGSRGARTYSAPPATNTAPSAAQPMSRTMTEPSRGGVPATAGAAGSAARPAAAQGNFFQRNPLMGGLLAGGLIGAMLGGGFFSGLGSMAGMLGFLLQIALIGGLVYLAVMLFRRRQQPAMAGMPREMAPQMAPDNARPAFGGGGGGSFPAAPAVNVTAADQVTFGETLVSINRAWSVGDTATLTRLATPEMVQYFRDDYEALAARGWKNETSDLRLESGDVAEAWNEGARDYCTVAMRFSLIDVTRNMADGAVVEGHPTNRQTVTEIWTFLRVQGGIWQLSAIQQTG